MSKAKKKTKLKPLSKQDHYEMWCKVENEGFGYYMLDYGPDMEAIAQLGFDRGEIEAAIELLERLRDRIFEGEQYGVDDE